MRTKCKLKEFGISLTFTLSVILRINRSSQLLMTNNKFSYNSFAASREPFMKCPVVRFYGPDHLCTHSLLYTEVLRTDNPFHSTIEAGRLKAMNKSVARGSVTSVCLEHCALYVLNPNAYFLNSTVLPGL